MNTSEAAAFRAGLEAAARVVEQPPCPDTRQDVAAAIRALPVPDAIMPTGETSGAWVQEVFKPLPQDEIEIFREVMDEMMDSDMPVPEGEVAEAAHDMTVCERCGTWRRSPCGEGCFWGIQGNEQAGFTAICAARGQG